MTPLVFVVGALGVVLALVGMSLSLGLQAVMHALLAIRATLAEAREAE